MPENNKTAYLIGIKGVGMAALAIFLKQDGWQVSGSDNANTYLTDETLRQVGIQYHEGFDKENLNDLKADYIIISAAYGKDNPEVKEAYRLKLNTLYYSEMLGKISADKRLIAIAGVHGKTTTTALVSAMLESAKLDPSFIIGAAGIKNLRGAAQRGRGEYFVLEADEYRQSPASNNSKFLDLNPEIAVITSIEFDHPDFFPTIDDVYQAFYRFACRVPRNGSIVLCLDYPKCQKIKNSLVDRNFETYGFHPDAKWKIIDVKEENQTVFSIECQNQIYGPFALKIPGQHNILNATVAFIIAKKLGIDDKIIEKVLADFSGVDRRFDEVGSAQGVQVIDDYAHHPTAIAKTLEAARAKFPDAKIWCIFQPHTYSRTKSLLKDFGKAFQAADNVIITDIYASEREKNGNVGPQELVKEIEKNQKPPQLVRYFENPEAIKKYLLDFTKGPAVILTMGAGDIYKLGPELVRALEGRHE